MVVDFLISLDGDGDGGIGHSEESFDFNDQSWVTSYLGYMGLDKLRIPVDLVIVPDTTTVQPGDLLRFTGTAVNNTNDTIGLEGWTEIYLRDGTPLPSNPVLGPFQFTLEGEGSVGLSFSQSLPNPAPTGT